ncbi:MAG: 3-deoxy-D-manno-octulosonic acid transferase, partial [bacterium]
DHLLRAGGARLVPNAEELGKALSSLLRNPSEAAQVGEKAFLAVQQHQGASERILEFLRPVL